MINVVWEEFKRKKRGIGFKSGFDVVGVVMAVKDGWVRRKKLVDCTSNFSSLNYVYQLIASSDGHRLSDDLNCHGELAILIRAGEHYFLVNPDLRDNPKWASVGMIIHASGALYDLKQAISRLNTGGDLDAYGELDLDIYDLINLVGLVERWFLRIGEGL